MPRSTRELQLAVFEPIHFAPFATLLISHVRGAARTSALSVLPRLEFSGCNLEVAPDHASIKTGAALVPVFKGVGPAALHRSCMPASLGALIPLSPPAVRHPLAIILALASNRIERCV